MHVRLQRLFIKTDYRVSPFFPFLIVGVIFVKEKVHLGSKKVKKTLNQDRVSAKQQKFIQNSPLRWGKDFWGEVCLPLLPIHLSVYMMDDGKWRELACSPSEPQPNIGSAKKRRPTSELFSCTALRRFPVQMMKTKTYMDPFVYKWMHQNGREQGDCSSYVTSTSFFQLDLFICS